MPVGPQDSARRAEGISLVKLAPQVRRPASPENPPKGGIRALSFRERRGYAPDKNVHFYILSPASPNPLWGLAKSLRSLQERPTGLRRMDPLRGSNPQRGLTT